MIYDAAAGLVSNPPPAKPWKIVDPELKVIFQSGPYHNKFRELYNCGDSIAITGTTITECWAKYWQMKLETQEKMK